MTFYPITGANNVSLIFFATPVVKIKGDRDSAPGFMNWVWSHQKPQELPSELINSPQRIISISYLLRYTRNNFSQKRNPLINVQVYYIWDDDPDKVALADPCSQ